MNDQVHITLKELKTGRVVSRDIDISNLHCHMTGETMKSKSGQKGKIEEWIRTRGEDQHDSKLELLHWVVW